MSGSSYSNLLIPQTIRIGFEYGKTGASNSYLYSKTGYNVGYDYYGTHVKLFDLPYINEVEVRKDKYYVDSKNGIVEYRKSDSYIPSGTRYGPYHIQVGGSYSSFWSAYEAAQNFTSMGTNSFVAYIGGVYYVWEGMYNSVTECNNNLDSVKNKLNKTVKLTYTSTNGLQLFEKGKEFPLLVYDAGSYMLYLKPIDNKVDTPVIMYKGTNYRGGFEFLRNEDNDMAVINILNFDQYLYGVVTKEMGSYFPLEALKAQAVAARTFVMANMDKYKKYGFNLCATDYSQVYGGYDSEEEKTSKAVRETTDKILTYNGEIADVFYFSSSGGHTENIQNVWWGNEIPYLKGVPDPYEPEDKASYASWEFEFTPEELAYELKKNGYDLGDRILSVDILEYSEAHRVTKIQITGNRDSLIVDNYKTRYILKNHLLSQYYSVSRKSDVSITWENGNTISKNPEKLNVLTKDGLKIINSSYVIIAGSDGRYGTTKPGSDTFVFTGKGYGHGVGLSQWGAYGMANAGFDYIEIMTHYFPGTEVQ